MSQPSWAGTLEARGTAALMSTYARYPIELVSGRGCRLKDSSGREYLDCVAGIAVNVLGHAHETMVEAIRGAADGLIHSSNLYWTEPMIRLAERLNQAAGMDRAFFCNSGAEAVEAMLKLALRARPGRSKVVCFERSFHGRTIGALSVTAQEKYQAPYRAFLPKTTVLSYGDVEAAAACIDETTAAVIIEPLQGEGGVRPAPADYLRRLRELCDRTGALLLFDEVQTGFGRTGSLFAFHEVGVVPDALSGAKALAAGLPMGVMLARGEASTAFKPGDHASTFGGGPFVATVANAVLDFLLAPGFFEEVRRRGERLGAGLQGLVDEHACVLGTRGLGLMRGLVLDGPRAAELVGALRERGLLTCPAGPDVVRLVPPLIITDAEIDEALGIFDEAVVAMVAKASER